MKLKPRFHNSKKALAIPVTFFMLFVSLSAIVSVTYYFAVSKVQVRSQTLKISAAKQNMNYFEQNLQFVLWQTGSSKTFEFDDCGGTLKVEPDTNSLLINIADETSINDIVFDSVVGRVRYELPYSETADTGLFLKGDSQVVVNKSGSVMTQLYIRSGEEHPEILLQYRPKATSVSAGNESDKPVNFVRIYLVNLNSSQSINVVGKFPVKISCLDTEVSVYSYNISYSFSSLSINVTLDETQNQVAVPISSNANGAMIYVELTVSNIKIERWER